MKHAKIILILFAVIFVLAISSLSDEENVTSAFEVVDVIPEMEKILASYDEHNSIRILNDTDFMWQAGNESWEGDGSFDTP